MQEGSRESFPHLSRPPAVHNSREISRELLTAEPKPQESEEDKDDLLIRLLPPHYLGASAMSFTSVIDSIAYLTPFRPNPESFTPPYGI